MATVVTKKLRLDKNNIENYCNAKNVSFNVADHAWRKWLNGSSDGYIILKDNGKAELFPTSTAHPFKADSTMSASRSAGTCIVDLQFAGTKVHEESYTSGSQHSKSKENITDSAVIDSTRATEIKWHVHGKNGDNQRGDLLELILYFNQYNAQALISDGSTGIQSASVSNLTPYYGDTITFSVKLAQDVTFDGWYSDSACTQLVSTDQNYSVSPSSDITLYAKATANVTLYNVSAVAGSEIASVSVSDSIVPNGGAATFTAQVNAGCSFEAWYSDNTYTTVISTENPYTATITADTILYAKATRKRFNIAVGPVEHGTASVSATTVPYNSDVTFTFTPEDETWELYGWYSDAGLTQLVSEANPYTFTVTEDMTLYPKVGKKRYTIKYGRARDLANGGHFKINIVVVDFNSLTRDEINCLRTGDYDSIDSSKIVARDSINGSNIITDLWKTIQCTYDMHVAVYLPEIVGVDNYYALVRDGNGNDLTYWPYYWFQPTANATISSYNRKITYWCNCSAVTKDGITYAYATTPTLQEKEAIFEAELSPGYRFLGWYSDEACTTLVSTDNPANVVTPKYTTDMASQTSITLYAKAIISEASSGIHLKQNGAYAQAKAIWKKTNGVWDKTDKTAIDATKKYRLIKN